MIYVVWSLTLKHWHSGGMLAMYWTEWWDAGHILDRVVGWWPCIELSGGKVARSPHSRVRLDTIHVTENTEKGCFSLTQHWQEKWQKNPRKGGVFDTDSLEKGCIWHWLCWKGLYLTLTPKERGIFDTDPTDRGSCYEERDRYFLWKGCASQRCQRFTKKGVLFGPLKSVILP